MSVGFCLTGTVLTVVARKAKFITSSTDIDSRIFNLYLLDDVSKYQGCSFADQCDDLTDVLNVGDDVTFTVKSCNRVNDLYWIKKNENAENENNPIFDDVGCITAVTDKYDSKYRETVKCFYVKSTKNEQFAFKEHCVVLNFDGTLRGLPTVGCSVNLRLQKSNKDKLVVLSVRNIEDDDDDDDMVPLPVYVEKVKRSMLSIDDLNINTLNLLKRIYHFLHRKVDNTITLERLYCKIIKHSTSDETFAFEAGLAGFDKFMCRFKGLFKKIDHYGLEGRNTIQYSIKHDGLYAIERIEFRIKLECDPQFKYVEKVEQNANEIVEKKTRFNQSDSEQLESQWNLSEQVKDCTQATVLSADRRSKATKGKFKCSLSKSDTKVNSIGDDVENRIKIALLCAKSENCSLLQSVSKSQEKTAMSSNPIVHDCNNEHQVPSRLIQHPKLGIAVPPIPLYPADSMIYRMTPPPPLPFAALPHRQSQPPLPVVRSNGPPVAMVAPTPKQKNPAPGCDDLCGQIQESIKTFSDTLMNDSDLFTLLTRKYSLVVNQGLRIYSNLNR